MQSAKRRGERVAIVKGVKEPVPQQMQGKSQLPVSTKGLGQAQGDAKAGVSQAQEAGSNLASQAKEAGRTGADQAKAGLNKGLDKVSFSPLPFTQHISSCFASSHSLVQQSWSHVLLFSKALILCSHNWYHDTAVDYSTSAQYAVLEHTLGE